MNVNSNLKSTDTYCSTIHTKYTEVWRIWIIKQPLLNSRQRDNWAVRSCSVQDWRAYILGPMQHRNQVWGYLINNPEHTMGMYHLAIWVSGMQYSTLYVQWSNISQWHELPGSLPGTCCTSCILWINDIDINTQALRLSDADLQGKGEITMLPTSNKHQATDLAGHEKNVLTMVYRFVHLKWEVTVDA